jgi:two-component system CheB/CheR fusion protein
MLPPASRASEGKMWVMTIRQVTEPTHIQPNHVYVIPPNRDLTLDDGQLLLADAERPRGRHVAIDLFFRALAEAYHERAFGIVLSGTGSDGTLGLKSIKEQGGIILAQTPSDAEYDSMPRSAIGTGLVDFILPVVEMPQKLLQIWANATEIELPPAEEMPEAPVKLTPTAERQRTAEEALRDILLTLRTRTGHDFTHYKRATVLRRIERRLQINSLKSLPEYSDFLREHKEETASLLKDMLISVTNFFRDREAFEALEREIIPPLLAEKAAGEAVRVWVPGCATGEEAYSVTMLLCEYIAKLPHPLVLQAFATDIDERAIAVAREGRYPESIVADIPPTRLRNFFTKEGSQYCVRKELREKILFAIHNLVKDPPFSKLDLICCRNLLIYLNRDVQREVLELLHFALRPGGTLFLGNSESADAAAQLFTPIDKKNRLFRANVVARAGRRVPNLPLGAQYDKYLVREVTSNEKRKVSFGELHQKLLEQYAPPSVIINHDYDIVHLSDRAGRFLQFVGGEPSHNLLKVVHPELRLDLRTALFQAIQSGLSVEALRVRLQREDSLSYVNMIVRPVHDLETASNFVLVLFDEVQDTMSTEAKEVGAGEPEPVVHQLEAELHRTKEQLQGTIEQYETSTEELKASNEELQAINEELRSTTEELETSKEELQSINEELVTVNQELKNKVDETSRINDDLQNLIASTDIATVFVDRALRIHRYMPRALDIFNLIPSDVGRPLLDITHRLDYDKLANDLSEVFSNLHVIEREVQDTAGRFYLARLLPYRTTDDRIGGAVLTFIDITRRRLAEVELRSSEERLRLLIESAQDYAIFTLDEQGQINSWNSGAERMFGYQESEVLGQPTEILFLPEDRSQGAHLDEMRMARAEGRATDERWHLRKDGTRLYCSGVMRPLRNDKFYGYAKIARDLTEHKQTELEREKLLEREKAVRASAENTNKIKDEFLAILSHELKHPLNLIRLSTDVLSHTPAVLETSASKRAIATISQTVATQNKMIDDLLDFSRAHSGKLTLNCEMVRFDAVLDPALDAMRAEAEAKQIALEVHISKEPLLVYADASRLDQIIWNLLSNALKFTPAGGRVVVRLEQQGEEAQLSVEDTGKGINPAFLPQVFEMFEQSDASTTRRFGGLGIGLALVKQLTELHGGRVAVNSAGEGQGACFTVWLPLYQTARPRL